MERQNAGMPERRNTKTRKTKKYEKNKLKINRNKKTSKLG